MDTVLRDLPLDLLLLTTNTLPPWTLESNKVRGLFVNYSLALLSAVEFSQFPIFSLTNHMFVAFQVPLLPTPTDTASRELPLDPNLLTPSMLPLWTPESKLVRKCGQVSTDALSK